MGFLFPLFFVGLTTLAVPVIIHMIQRERKEVVEFPSLMFLRQIPFRSFRRQRIRNWLLLLLRCLAVLLMIAAFARPFFRADAIVAVTSEAREVVILLDRSYSMGYSDRWERAREAASEVVDEMGPDDQATVIFFDNGAEAGSRSTRDRSSLLALINDTAVGSGTTRYGPGLKLAEGIFENSSLPHLEAVFISDFQRSGVESAIDVRFPEGTVVTPVSVLEGENSSENVSVAGVLFEREYFSGRERVAVGARIMNRGNREVDSEVTLELDGREIETLGTKLPPNGSETVNFAPVTLGDRTVAGLVRTREDRLAIDDIFHFVLSQAEIISVLIVGNDRRPSDGALYLSRALAIGENPSFEVQVTRVDGFSAEDLEGRQVVVLNDTRPPTGQAAVALEQFVREGGGLLVVAGERSAWPPEAPELLPGSFERPVDRDDRGGRLGFVDYSHPVFDLFSTPRSGDITTARFFRYRTMDPVVEATVLARFDDGVPALLEREVGEGKVFFWASTLDNFWSDIALKPVYLPFVHRIVEYLAAYSPASPWHTAGQVINLAEQRKLLADANLDDSELVAVDPNGNRIPVTRGNRAGFLSLTEQGLYEIHDVTNTVDVPLTLAVNVDLAEADFSAIDPFELASSLTGHLASEQGEVVDAAAREFAPEDLERSQGVWWYLLLASFALFLSETVFSNRLSHSSIDLN